LPDRISRDDATEILGRAKFGDAWVGPAPDEEFKLAKEYRRRLRDRLPISEELEWAAEREARADRQRREVNHWLENRGFTSLRDFDRNAFNKAVEAEFGKARRKSAVLRKHTRYATDTDLVDEAFEGIAKRIYPNALKAAEALASRAEGTSNQAKINRLRKKIARALKITALAP
jgi:hypothetical protein